MHVHSPDAPTTNDSKHLTYSDAPTFFFLEKPSNCHHFTNVICCEVHFPTLPTSLSEVKIQKQLRADLIIRTKAQA